MPTGEPIWGIAAYRPRFSGGACSTARVIAPPHSPPTATPCSRRRRVSSTGAAMPMSAKSGSTPTSPVTMPIMTTVISRHARRPMRSPRWPKMIPPSGRAANPTAKEANAARVATTASSVAKNSRLNTRDAAVP